MTRYMILCCQNLQAKESLLNAPSLRPATVVPLHAAPPLWQEGAKLLRVPDMPDYAALRTMMVDTQVRPSDVTKLPIISAMLTIPREVFVPRDKADVAYAELNLPLGGGRTMLQPRTLAKLLDALAITKDELVLDVAPGTGYSSAVIAHMAEAVVAIESSEDMAKDAQAAFEAIGVTNIAIEIGAAEAGAPAHGPYDVLIVQGGIEILPDALIAQVKDGGRIGALFVDGALGVAKLGIKRGDRVLWRDIFNATAPVLDGFQNSRSFAL